MSSSPHLQTLSRVVAAFGMKAASVDTVPQRPMNAHWRVEAGGQLWALRRYSPLRSAAAISYEHCVLAALCDAEWPVAPPALSSTGETLVDIQGAGYALFPWLPGSPSSSHSAGTRNILGRLLARLHRDLASVPVDGQRDGFGRAWELDLFVQPAGVDSFNRLLARFAREHRELAAAVRSQRYRSLRELARLGYGDLPAQLIHGNLRGANALFADGRCTGVLDFDLCRLDAPAFDLAATIALECGDTSAPDVFDVDGALALVEGYARVRSLSSTETEMLPALVRAFWLWLVALRLVQWHGGDGKRSVRGIARTVDHRLPALEAASSVLREALRRRAAGAA